MLWPFKRPKAGPFEGSLRAHLRQHSLTLPEPLWRLIAWLEAQGQCFRYRHGGDLFVTLSGAQNRDAVWSHIAFHVPQDLVRHWLGAEGHESTLVPLVRSAGDGSYLAVWRPDEATSVFVFLGSEGEAFVVSETVESFIALLSMGYVQIEGRFDLSFSPEEQWQTLDAGPWPEPTRLKAWTAREFGILHPNSGEDLLPYPPGDDPFTEFVAGLASR